MSKIEKNKVGRPKLADKKLKKESIIVVSVVILLMMVTFYCGFKILTFNFDVKKTVGTVYNDHVNSCVIKNNKIDCGPNVVKLKYKINENDYKEIEKEYSSIKVKIEKNINRKFCYQVKDSDYKCN